MAMNGHSGPVPTIHNPDKTSRPRLDLPSSYHQGGVTFAFRKRWGQLDWRKLASVNVDRIAKEMDFEALQQNIMNITFCNIETEEFRNVDPNFVKVFRLSQLIIEYLLHSQQYLSTHSTSLQQTLLQLRQELDKTVNDLKSREEELKAIKKENRKRRKVIEAYQDMINAGATGLHTCPVCNREFVSGEYLLSHIHRRHPNHLPKSEIDNGAKNKPLVSQEELEARLMDQMTERLLISEKQLREEMNQKEQETINLHIKDFEDWKEKEKERMVNEMEEFKRPIIAELEEVQREKATLEKTLQEKEDELLQAQSKRQSHLGHLDGAKELILDETNQSKAEINHLKESLELQLQEMQTALKKQDQSWKKRVQKLSASYQDQLAESVAKLGALERSMLEGSQNARDKNISQKLKSLQQKMKQQEELLQSQQDQLTTLQSREPSPIPPRDKDGDDFTYSDDSDDEDSDDNDQTDFHDGKFTPFPHQPMIKTKYAHNQDDIEKIRRQTEAIFSDTLVHKGITRDMNGLKSSDFEQKMSILRHEQQQKIQMHYHFAEHRQRLSHILNEAAAAYKPTQKLQLPSLKQKSNATTKGLGKPPKPTVTITLPQTDTQHEVKNDVEGVHLLTESVECDETDKADSLASISAVSNSTISSIQLHTSDQPYSENINVTVVVTDTAATPPPQERSTIQEELHAPSASDNSFEDLVTPHSGRISSTPIKALGPNDIKSTGHKPQQVESISLDSFDLSSSGDPAPATLPSKADPVYKLGSKPQSGTVTSQSALTSVSMDDFDSDLDISDLT